MRILMIGVPTEEKMGSLPFGILYAASSVERHGHVVKVLDLVKEDTLYPAVKAAIDEFVPDIIGMGGITSGYKNCKELIRSIRGDFKNIPIIIGGVISSISDLLLTKAGADIVVHGEAEAVFPNLVSVLEKKEDISKVEGISFLKDGLIHRTADELQIKDLDEIPFPHYKLLKMDRYFVPLDTWIYDYFKYDIKEYRRIKDMLTGERYFLQIITARGCTHKCIFCYRHYRGWRQHSVSYVVNHIKYLKDTYGIGVFQINDELTTMNREWVLEFCDKLIAEKLGVFFIVLSSRVDSVDEEVLLRLKRAGCLMINYGYESGSEAIIREIKKGVTRQDALNAGLLTRKVGIKNVPEIIIGFPSETEETIAQTTDFLKRLDVWPISINTPIPFPETALWQYAVERGIIKDKEDFVLRYKRGVFVNFTAFSDKKLRRLITSVSHDVKLNWHKNRKEYFLYAQCLVEKYLVMAIKTALPARLVAGLKKSVKAVLKG